MTEFKNTTLRNKISIKHGFSFKGEFFTQQGDYILLTPGNFYEVGGFKFDENKAKFYEGEIPDDYICEKGDLIVAMTEQAEGLLGSSAIVPIANRFLHNQRIGLVKVDDKEVNKMFLYHLLNTKSVREQIRLSSSGSKVKHTSPDRIYDVIVNLPSIDTQQKIAAVLSALDAKIEINNRINAELEAMAKTLYDYWFVQFDFPDADGKPYKTNGGSMVWNDELKREIPAGWEVSELGEVLSLEYGKPLKEGDRIGDKYPVLGSNGIVGYHDEYLIEGPGIVVGRKGTAGAVVWIEENFYPIDTTFYVKDKLGLDKLVFYYLLLQHVDLQKMESSSAVPGLNRNSAYSIKIVVPKISVIQEFHLIANPLSQKAKTCNNENQHLSSLRDWLLPMLMNGQVQVGEAVAPAQALATEKTDELAIADSKKGFAKQVLGGKIVSLFQNDPNFTNIKFQKLQYLAEHVAEVDLNWNYYYQAAGPYDNVYMHTIYDRFKTSQWFVKPDYKFIALEKQPQIEGYYQAFFKPVIHRLDHLFTLLAHATDIEAEIIATLYAVWNNRIILKQPITDEVLIDDFYSWSDRKLMYIPEQLQIGLQWLRINNIVPNGFGKELKKTKGRR